MPAFPTYGADEIAAIDEQAAAMLGVFAAGGYTRCEPSILQPVDIFIDRSGEDIRRRTFELTDPSGNELCLRPDLTIPICKMAVDSGAKFPARLCYHGLAFRHQQSNRPTQFYQAGAELLGFEDRAAADIEIMKLTVGALRAAGLATLDMKIGDLNLFAALVDALDVPPQWRGRLKRHFWRSGYFEALLARMVAGATNDAQRLIVNLHAMKAGEVRPAIERLLALQGDLPSGARTREEIVERLAEQAADNAALKLDSKVADTITAMLAVSGPAPKALADIRTLTKPVAAKMQAPLAAMESRLAALKSLGVDPAQVQFVAHFGRNLEYYTGFVFEFWSRDAEGPVQIAGGGRYDTLLEAMGAPRSVPAIGCAIRTERVLAARGMRP